MLIKFETPCEALGGCDVFDTDGAACEDLILLLVDLARVVDRMKKERAAYVKALSSVLSPDRDGAGPEQVAERKLAEAIVNVVGGVDLITPFNALLLLVVGGLVASDDRVATRDIDRVVKRVAQKIARLAHHFRKEERGAWH